MVEIEFTEEELQELEHALCTVCIGILQGTMQSFNRKRSVELLQKIREKIGPYVPYTAANKFQIPK